MVQADAEYLPLPGTVQSTLDTLSQSFKKICELGVFITTVLQMKVMKSFSNRLRTPFLSLISCISTPSSLETISGAFRPAVTCHGNKHKLNFQSPGERQRFILFLAASLWGALHKVFWLPLYYTSQIIWFSSC